MERYNLPYTTLSGTTPSVPKYEKYDVATYEQPFISSPSRSETVRTLPYMTPRYSNTAPVDTEDTLLLKRVHDSFVHSALRDDAHRVNEPFMATIKQAVNDRVLFEDTYDHLKQVYDQYLQTKNEILQLRHQIASITPEQYGSTLGALMYEYNRKVVNLNEALGDLNSQISIETLQTRCQSGKYCNIDTSPCTIKDGRCDYRYDPTDFDAYFKK